MKTLIRKEGLHSLFLGDLIACGSINLLDTRISLLSLAFN